MSFFKSSISSVGSINILTAYAGWAAPSLVDLSAQQLFSLHHLHAPDIHKRLGVFNYNSHEWESSLSLFKSWTLTWESLSIYKDPLNRRKKGKSILNFLHFREFNLLEIGGLSLTKMTYFARKSRKDYANTKEKVHVSF